MTWSSALAAASVAPPPTFWGSGSAGISVPSLVVKTNFDSRRSVFSIFLVGRPSVRSI
jgi:hypothetical protein